MADDYDQYDCYLDYVGDPYDLFRQSHELEKERYERTIQALDRIAMGKAEAEDAEFLARELRINWKGATHA
jgi:hypothetical protein